MLEHLENIKKGIDNNQYPNEISVIDGIIKPLLYALNWNIFDTINSVIPEYLIAGNGKRVDIALCDQKRPCVFVECKKMGGIDDNAQEQLLNYAFREGVPMAILTDGRQWNFYLPAEQGSFSERQFYQLDLIARETVDIENKLNRYLKYEFVISGEAIENAKKDYKDAKTDKEIIAQLPKAWEALVKDKDELLVEALAEKVESMCGYKASEKAVLDFLHTLDFKRNEVIKKPLKIISKNDNLTNNIINSVLKPKSWLEVTEIQSMVCHYYDVSMTNLMSKKRTQHLVIPRQMAMHLSKQYTRLAFADIGMTFRRDHSTVIHANKKIPELVKHNPIIKEDYQILKLKIHARIDRYPKTSL